MVIDVGANVGFFTLLFSILVGQHGKVYAFEPHPRIYKYLRGNLALNTVKNVHTYNIALGSRNKTTHFSNNKTGDAKNLVVD